MGESVFDKLKKQKDEILSRGVRLSDAEYLAMQEREKRLINELGKSRDSAKGIKELYDRVFDDREALLAALRLCLKKGHHDTCSHALSKEYACDCGYEAGCKAIGNRMSNEGIATIMKAAEADDDRLVTVCDNCLMACCWQGEFMCDEVRTAGTVEKPVAELRKLGRESPHYWGPHA